MSTVKVQKQLDVVKLTDHQIQTVLIEFIERSTGRKVNGDVTITIDSRLGQVGNSREGMYTATCTLKPESN